MIRTCIPRRRSHSSGRRPDTPIGFGSHGQARRPPPPRRGGVRHRAGPRPRSPDSDQAHSRSGRQRRGRRQHGVRVHGVHPDGVDLEGRDGREHHAGAGRRGRQRRGDLGPAVLGRAHGAGPRLLRARQPGHLQRPRALHGQAAVLDAPRLRRHRRAPRMVLQLRRGHRHGPAQGVRPAALHRRAVARRRRRALQARRRSRPLQRRRRGRQGGVTWPAAGCGDAGGLVGW